MKKFLTLMTATLLIGFISSCSKEDSDSSAPVQPKNTTEFINQELSVYAHDEDVDIESVRKNLMSFNKALLEADKKSISDSGEIGELFVNNSKDQGVPVYSNSEIQVFDLDRPEGIPTELLKALRDLVKTAEANNIDEYISNLDAYYKSIKASNLKGKNRMAILGSVVTLKVIAKTIRFFKPKLKGKGNEKWRKQLKCAFKSLSAGLAGSLEACVKGAGIVGGITSKGGKVGSIVGCTIGAVIKGVVTITKTAKSCVKTEGI